MPTPDPRSDRDESRRILDRIQQENNVSGGLIGRGTERMRRHLAADDTDQSDPIEVMGTRIGRGLALVVTIAIVGWLLYYLAGG